MNKPTKVELENKVLELQSIVDSIINEEDTRKMIEEFAKELKDAHIKGLVQGFEVANQMLIEYSDGHSLEEVLDFCKKNIEQKSVMESVVSGKGNEDE